MINKNQFEKSIIFINKELPELIRKMFSESYQCLNELYDQLTKSSGESGYSVNKTVSCMMTNRRMMFVYSRIFPEEVLNARFRDISRKVKAYAKGNDMKLTSDETFYTVNSADIYAPVTSIDLAVTPYAYMNTENIVPLMFEISEDFSCSEPLVKEDYGYNVSAGALDIEGFNGAKTVLDNLSTVMNIDAIKLIDTFFYEMSLGMDVVRREDENTDESNVNKLSFLLDILNRYQDATVANNIIEKVTKKILASAISTYLIYASRLIGAKNDVYSWAYTAFVKDSLSTLDKALYPASVNITDVSGHTTNKYSESNNANLQFEDSSEIEDIKRRPSVYNSIKMQYSVWSACISAIMSEGFKRLAISRNTDYKNKSEMLSISSKIWDSDFAKICEYVNYSLIAYLSARYRTFNTSQCMDYITGGLYQSVGGIKYTVSQIKDETAGSIIKNTTSGFKIKDIYIGVSDTDYSILCLNKCAVSSMSKMFLYGAYLYMLSIIKAKLGKSYTEIEPNTGKTRQALFEEIYNGVCNRISNILKNARNYTPESLEFMHFSSEEKRMLTDIARKFTPFNSAMTMYSNRTMSPCFDILDKDFITKEYSIIANIKTDSKNLPESLRKAVEYEAGYVRDCKTYLKIPFYSEMCILGRYAEYFDKYCSYVRMDNEADINKDDPSCFPKNKMILDSISTMNLSDGAFNTAFKTIESADTAITSLESVAELAGEGADAMANNGCYSVLGSLCGGVRSLEITNSADETDNIDIDGSNPESVINSDSKTDGSGRIISDGTSDTLDQATVTMATESYRANMLKDVEKCAYKQLTDRFDDLFDKLVLGKK